MTEFAFLNGKDEKMRAVWGDLSICPHLDSLELLSHTPGELLSINHLKIWGTLRIPITTWPIS